MTNRRQALVFGGTLATFGSAGTLPAQARAQSAYPAHPVKAIVPWPAGGNADVTIRPILDRMAQILGQPIVVENRAGATGVVGSAVAARAPADGYTLLQLASSTVLNGALTGDKHLDLLREFDPIGLAAATPLVLEVHPSVPAASVKELIAHAKGHPGKVSYASGGVGTTAHLLSELLKLRAGLDVTHIPYQGGAPAVTDLLGGHVNMYFDVLPTAMPVARQGRVRILGITASQRSPKLPDVPTFSEQGLADMVASVWVGLLAPKGTPQPVLTRLNQALDEALADPGVRQRLDNIGAEPTPGTPDDLAALIRSDGKKWSEVVRKANIQAK